MAMASLTSGLLVRKGHARPSSFKPSSTPFRFENDDAVELLEETQRLAAQSSTPQPIKAPQQSKSKEATPVLTSVKTAKIKPVVAKKAKSTANEAKVKTALVKSSGASQEVARKTIRIRQDLNVTLRVLAARTGMSQKDIVESALVNYLEEKREELDCICGADDL
jgi:hypothetical protein